MTGIFNDDTDFGKEKEQGLARTIGPFFFILSSRSTADFHL
jgi:hypothetical protein